MTYFQFSCPRQAVGTRDYHVFIVPDCPNVLCQHGFFYSLCTNTEWISMKFMGGNHYYQQIYWLHQILCQVCSLSMALILTEKSFKNFWRTTLSCQKMAKTLFSVGSQVMWESLVMKKQMQLQNQHYLFLSLW